MASQVTAQYMAVPAPSTLIASLGAAVFLRTASSPLNRAEKGEGFLQVVTYLPNLPSNVPCDKVIPYGHPIKVGPPRGAVACVSRLGSWPSVALA